MSSRAQRKKADKTRKPSAGPETRAESRTQELVLYGMMPGALMC